jgi:ribose transport system permease protein
VGVSETGAQPGQSRALLYVERFALPTLFVAVLLFFSVWGKTGEIFRKGTNFQEVAASQAFIGVLAIALIIPLLCGEFDLSVGQVAGFTQVAAAAAMSTYHLPLAVAVLVGVGFGAAIGLINGSVVARIGVNSMIVTLGTSGVLLGVVNWYTNGESIGTHISPTLLNFGALNWLHVPRVFWLLLVVALLVWYLLEYTPYGRYLTSVGANEQAARLVGLRVSRIKLGAFVISGALAGLAGVLLLAVNGSASPQAGTIIDTLQALAAAFLGATAIRPGRFNVAGTVIAIYFLAFSVTGLQLAGIASYVNDVFNGAALFFAVILSTAIGRKRAGTV